MTDKAFGAGRVISARFRLEEMLEEHAGASLWRATDLALARSVSVYVIKADDSLAEAALVAAREAATVSDQRLLRVLDALEEGGFLCVVHEWGSGVSLDQMLADGPLEPRRAAWLIREVSSAIATAHRRGVAHGRLTPENVMVTETGSVKIIGFVVDAVLHSEEIAGSEDPLERDTRDLVALLYAALVGRWPGSSPSVIPAAPLEHGQVLRPRQVRAGVPPQLDVLCGDGLLLSSGHTGAIGRPHRSRTVSPDSLARDLANFLGDPQAGLSPALGPALVDPDATMAGQPDFAELNPLAPPFDAEATQLTMPEVETGEQPALVTPARTTVPAGAVSSAPPSARVPRDWGPDRPQDTGSLPPVGSGGARTGTPWLKFAAVLGALVLLALAVTIALNLGAKSGPGPAEESPGIAAKPVDIAAVKDFDPGQVGGTPEENPDLVALATDGDKTTAWRTVVYEDGPVLAPYKAGVGLLIDLGEEIPVSHVDVTLLGEPYDLQLLAAAAGASAPTTVVGLDSLDTKRGASGTVRLSPQDQTKTRFLVVWLTSLPSSGSGYQGQIAEIVVRS